MGTLLQIVTYAGFYFNNWRCPRCLVFAPNAGGYRATGIFTNASRHSSCGLSRGPGSRLLPHGVLFKPFNRNIPTSVPTIGQELTIAFKWGEVFWEKPKALPIQGSKLISQKCLTNIGMLRHDWEREKKGELAQLVEHYNGIVGVSGSSPLFSIDKI